MGPGVMGILLLSGLLLAPSHADAGLQTAMEGRWRRERSLEERELTVSALDTTITPSISQCAARCARKAGCCGVMWRAGVPECRLYPDLSTQDAMTAAPLTGARFYSWVDGLCTATTKPQSQLPVLPTGSTTMVPTFATAAFSMGTTHLTTMGIISASWVAVSASHSTLYPYTPSLAPSPFSFHVALPRPLSLSQSPTPSLPSTPTSFSVLSHVITSSARPPTLLFMSTTSEEDSSKKLKKPKSCGANNGNECSEDVEEEDD